MRVTVIGLGRMGGPLARNLVELGHEVTLYDRDPARAQALARPGAKVAADLAGAVEHAQVALTVVDGDAAEEALTFGPGGLLRSLGPGAVHLCMTNVGVALSRRMADAHQAARQGYVAAPVLGRPGFAASRHLWILAGGPDPMVNRCLGLLEGLGRGLTRVGERAELAHALALGASSLATTMVGALAETLAFGEKAGMASGEYLRILNLGLFKSPLLDAYGALMVRRDHAPEQTLDQAGQDLSLALAAGRDLGLPLPMAAHLLEDVRRAQAAGMGGLDVSALAELAPVMARERRRGGQPRAAGAPERRRGKGAARPPVPEVDWAPDAVTQPVPELPPEPAGEPPVAAVPARAPVETDYAEAGYFQVDGGSVWAWLDGHRNPTPWRSLDAVEAALPHILFVRLETTFLVNPQAVRTLEARFAGRAKVVLADGRELLAGREAASRLRLLMD